MKNVFKIPLGANKFALIDKADLPIVSSKRWYYSKSKTKNLYYANTYLGIFKGKQKRACMHRLILGLFTGDKREVDHINHNGLDNRRKNLRVCTHSQNLMNQRKKPLRKFKGTSHRQSGRWQAQIMCNKKIHHLGVFDSEREAAKAYDKASRILHGNFGLTNS